MMIIIIIIFIIIAINNMNIIITSAKYKLMLVTQLTTCHIPTIHSPFLLCGTHHAIHGLQSIDRTAPFSTDGKHFSIPRMECARHLYLSSRKYIFAFFFVCTSKILWVCRVWRVSGFGELMLMQRTRRQEALLYIDTD